MSLHQIVVLLVALQRLSEVVYGQENARKLLAAGGVEYGARHYPLFFVLHGAWLGALLVLVPAETPVNWWLIGLYLLIQAVRYWVMASLGGRWTTRVIVLPDAPLVTHGPYRVMRHPNYVIIAAEIAVLPLAFGAWWIALVFSVLNLALLVHRIRVEEAALAPLRGRSALT